MGELIHRRGYSERPLDVGGPFHGEIHHHERKPVNDRLHPWLHCFLLLWGRCARIWRWRLRGSRAGGGETENKNQQQGALRLKSSAMIDISPRMPGVLPQIKFGECVPQAVTARRIWCRSFDFST